MKESEGVSVIIRDFSLNPSCPHGPTILFSLKNGIKKFFGCSAFRYNCFKMELDQFERNKVKIMRHQIENKRSNKILNLQQVPRDDRIYCSECHEVLPVSSITSHKSHQIKVINDEFLQQPSLFLPQLDNDNLNAQYFFDDSTLQFILSVFNSLDLTSVICVGCPRLHDFLRVNSFKSILLDIDERFQAFYPNEFCHYNMFNHHFFNGNEDRVKLENFLEDSRKDERSHHCIFVDPPFAARTELLAFTLKLISHQYFKVNHKLLPIFWVFPYFNERHVERDLPEMEMLDFQVTYTNHSAFKKDYKGRKEGSPVRIFTNIKNVKYPSNVSNLYRYCQLCQRYVALNNRHCGVCKVCPSKNGSEYRHCDKCIKCVKSNYIHCNDCGRCTNLTQKSNHDCKIYQAHQECWGCLEKGHVENKCKKLKKFKGKNGKCRICNEKHNLRCCEVKWKYLND